MEQQRGFRFSDLRAWIDPLSIVVVVLILGGALAFVAGFVQPSGLLQALGGFLIGAGLSALVGAVTGRWAIQQQSAKEANVWRKEHTYGPLYTELKAVRAAFEQAEKGETSAPERIDNGVEVYRQGGIPIPPNPTLTLRYWPEFRRDYRDTEFKVATREQLDKVHDLTTTYNTAVEIARQVAVPDLATHADTAITELRQSKDYKQWQHAKRTATPVPIGHERKTPHDWYGYIEYMAELTGPNDATIGHQLAAQWLGRWGDPYVSHGFGWLLAKRPDKAAEYVRRSYPEGMMQNPPPDADWIRSIFETAWPALQQAPEFRAAVEAGSTLFQNVQAAEGILDRGLRDIQKQFQGGEPLV